jgi:TolB-like protein/Flp pilus assembly protein TadD
VAERPLEGARKPAGAVFLSYASEDAEAAQRISGALKAAGIEVWFDKSELRGGDAWDQRIRREIHDCALFIPVISAHSDARHEGYFRREWRLAVERAGDMSERVPFLVPVVIDDTSDSRADVPERFRAVQWTRLPAGVASPAFISRVTALLGAATSAATGGPLASALVRTTEPPRYARRPVWIALGVIALAVVIGSAWLAQRQFAARRSAAPLAATEKSIAVLPFIDLSEKRDQEYVADGIAEEILNLLVKIPGLRVIGRTSSFAYKGKQADLPSIGMSLGVAYLLEGSVRRSSDRIRVTAQLVYARDGSHLWSDTFEGNPTDILRLQDDIAARIAYSLSLEVRGQLSTREVIDSPQAYDFYLRGLREINTNAIARYDSARDYFQQALKLAPHFTQAALGIATADLYECLDAVQPVVSCPRTHASLDAALKLDPYSADAYAMRGEVLVTFNWDWAAATAAVKRAAELGGGPWTTFATARLATALGDVARARELYAEIIASDPFDVDAHFAMAAFVELPSERFEQAESQIRRALQLTPDNSDARFALGEIQLAQNKLQEALATIRDEKLDEGQLLGLALVYTAMGRKADADQALIAMQGNANYFPSDLARVYAFRGDAEHALDYLEKAYESHDPNLWPVKLDFLFRNLKDDPRYKSFLRKMKLIE